MLSVEGKGDFTKTIRFLKNAPKTIKKLNLDSLAEEGVTALSKATPVDTGKTASSWKYSIIKDQKSITISFENTNIQNGVPIAVILRYGHGTRNGGYVEGREYITPAIQPIFDKIVEKAWREIKKL